VGVGFLAHFNDSQSEFIPMLLNRGTQVIPTSQNDQQSASLRCGIAELNRNTVRLITQALELVEESKQLSEQIKSFENRSARPKPSSPTRY
jgi:hypothetical protein